LPVIDVQAERLERAGEVRLDGVLAVCPADARSADEVGEEGHLCRRRLVDRVEHSGLPVRITVQAFERLGRDGSSTAANRRSRAHPVQTPAPYAVWSAMVAAT